MVQENKATRGARCPVIIIDEANKLTDWPEAQPRRYRASSQQFFQGDKLLKCQCLATGEGMLVEGHTTTAMERSFGAHMPMFTDRFIKRLHGTPNQCSLLNFS